MGRVLVVEQNTDALEAVAMSLELLSHQVETAATAAEALAKVSSFRPEVVTTNLRLPDMDGLSLIRAIRARRDVRPFIICVTGASDPRQHQEARDAGCDLVMLKPVELDLLGRAVADGCARTAARAGGPGDD
jgi:DNA-binding response OmpR family regulator